LVKKIAPFWRVAHLFVVEELRMTDRGEHFEQVRLCCVDAINSLINNNIRFKTPFLTRVIHQLLIVLHPFDNPVQQSTNTMTGPGLINTHMLDTFFGTYMMFSIATETCFIHKCHPSS